MFDLIIVSNKRVNNITLTYFHSANQIFYSRKQYIEGSSEVALDAFKEYKTKDDTIVLNETEHYAFMQRKGFLDFDIFHLKSPNGMAVYIDYGVIQLD